MKRKYYLRGLGFGILITSLVFMLTGPKEMSDEEIIHRAMQLGYMKVDEDVTPTINLSELKEKGTPTPVLTKEPDPTAAEEPGVTDVPLPTEAPEVTDVPVPTPTEEPVATPSPELTATPALTITPEPTVVISTPTPTTESTQQPSEETIQVEVEPGDSARKVCAKMEQAGVIEDAGEFRNYLTKNNWADDINIGVHSFKKNMEFRELARVLTGK